MIRRIALKVCAWVLLTLAWAVFVGFLASRLQAQEVRYEYRAQPEGEPKPLLIPCFVLDRFNFLCIETGDIFVDVAGGSLLPLAGAFSSREAAPSPTPVLAPLVSAVHRGSRPHTDKLGGSMRAIGSVSAFHAAATPSIILAHQKIASDGWVDRTKNKKGERCCDANKDCHSLNPEEVKHVPGGVDIRLGEQTIHIPGDEIMPSEDGRYWVCYWGNKVRCFFAPYSGS